MSNSMRDQLVRAGLASKNDARKAARQQSRQARQKPHDEDAGRQAARKAEAAKAARDRELERERKAQTEKRARSAEIRQLVERHCLPPVDSDEYFHFVDGGKVRRVPVTSELRLRIASGEFVIVRGGGRYALVPPAIAERIAERDAEAVMKLDADAGPPASDSQDAHHAVPDDLIW